jgi:hypothetical protein
MTRYKPIFFLILCAAAALPALAGPARYVITAEQAAAAVTAAGVQVAPDRILLLTEVVANVAAPALKVTSIDRMSPERAIARIECADAQQCLPFMVSIHLTESNGADSLAAASRLLQASVRGKPAPLAVRAGSAAILLLNGAHVHISLGVICLENGSVGQTIRATDRDRHQIYIARVTQDGVLEGRL